MKSKKFRQTQRYKKTNLPNKGP